jgi:predicted nuclease of predicted toxin-antitoxin system
VAEPVRFHLDEHMDPDIAVALAKYGINATTTVQQRLLGRPDEAHLILGRVQSRVIVTDDTDFLIAGAKSNDHGGIVFCRRTRHTLGEIIRFLILVHEIYTAEEMKGRVEFL